MGNLDPFREAGNPLFNDNKLKLGILKNILLCPAATWRCEVNESFAAVPGQSADRL
jgi:hypothetical protein